MYVSESSLTLIYSINTYIYSIDTEKDATEKEIQAIREKLHKKPSKKTGINLDKYSGILKLKEDPLVIQTKMRDEWR